MREVRIWQAVDVLTGLGVIITAVVLLGGAVGWLDARMFLAALLLGVLMIYSVWLMLTAGTCWVVRVENILEIFESLYQAGRWPVGVYPGWLRSSLTFLLPVAFAVMVSAQALTSRLNAQTLLLAFGLALGLQGLARVVWCVGLRNYSGASA